MKDTEPLSNVVLSDGHELAPGTKLGPYRLLDKVGFGAFGDVWRAEHVDTNRVAALKVFEPDRFSVAERGAAAERFRDGAKAMQRLDGNANVIRLFEGPTVSGGRLWFAMEYYQHNDLERWIRRRPDILYVARLGLIHDMLDGLEAAHRQGVIHRDVRPGNILIADDGEGVRAVLADFDIAYFEDFLRKRETTTAIMGWPRYLPPDVFGATGDEIPKKLRRPGNDLYALSVVAFDLLSGGGRSIPDKVTKKALVKLFPKRSPKSPYGLTGTTIRRLASFFSVALQRDAPAFDSVAAFRLAWASAVVSTRSMVPLLAVPLTLLFAGLVVFDWAHDRWADEFVVKSAVVLVTALFELGVIATGSKLLWTLMAGTIPPWKQHLTAWRADRPIPFWLVTAAVAGCSGVIAFRCWPTERAKLSYVSSAQGCLGITRTGAVDAWFLTPDREQIDVSRVSTIRCHPSVEPKITRRSFLTPALEVQRSGRPNGTVTPSWLSPTELEVQVARERHALSLAGVRTFTEPTTAAPSNLPREPVRVEVLDPTRPTNVLIRRDEKDVGGSLLAEGLLRVDAQRGPPADYARIETQAKAEGRGNWKTLATLQKHRKLLATCPDACCAGTPCEEKQDCTSRWACVLCRDGRDSARWKTRLDGVLVADSGAWDQLKVCISVGDEYAQNCVLVRDAGTPLGVFDGDYDAREAANMHFVVLGTNRAGVEQRIGQRTTSWKITARNLCEPRQVRNLERRNGQVQWLKFSTLGPL